ncbi:hypothetical protein N4G70_28935 [Streptomyces sp. ASQP_92]|uniref:hypothetical protein n=1 Tax=Streptomyces sp. ASQP_92 TaxID=2979116 RepID=UPI0021BF1C61|nr:hypothetical protein [Streptomyces sp. ASQP_92]MCT9092866.1 hypothetical protein [Streptomyces sp. ASQP_92]
MTVTAITATNIVKRYAANIAYVAEAKPATDLDSFIDQLETATIRFDRAGINGHEELETVRIFLAEALYNTDDDTERAVLLRKADKLLKPVWDMTDEYRGMVGD